MRSGSAIALAFCCAALALAVSASGRDANQQAAPQSDDRSPPTLQCALRNERSVGGLGAYVGNSVEEVVAFENWLGRPVDYVAAYTGRANWRDWEGSVGWAVGFWSRIDRCRLWSIPLFANEGNLASAAAGEYNARYREAARQLAASRPRDRVIVIRTGEEFNGDWMPWASKGREATFVEAFRQFVTSFRSVSPRFRFEWNVNVGDYGTDPESAYPGDNYVDIIGMDFYYGLRHGRLSALAWNYMVGRKYGLAWHQDFAGRRGKPTAYSEWGVEPDGAQPYIQAAAAWFKTHGVAYQIYWDSNADFSGKLSAGEKQASNGRAYRAVFGRAPP